MAAGSWLEAVGRLARRTAVAMFALGVGAATLTVLGGIRGTVHDAVGAASRRLPATCRPVEVTELWFEDVEDDGIPDLVVRVGEGPRVVLERAPGGRFVPTGC